MTPSRLGLAALAAAGLVAVWLAVQGAPPSAAESSGAVSSGAVSSGDGNRVAPTGGAGFRLAAADRGDIVSAVAATGAVEPVTLVEVGTQVSGQITELRADFNSEVRKGDVLAVIDQRDFETAVREARADLEFARANTRIHQAALDRVHAELAQANAEMRAAGSQTGQAQVAVAEALANLKRRETLARGGSGSAVDLDQARFAHQAAVANLETLKAREDGRKAAVAAMEAQIRFAGSQLEAAEAAVLQKAAALTRAETELERSLIRSPVDGTVIAREVEVGQTVASDLEAPTLFVIAQDLRRMLVKLSVDEADVGRIREGQPVVFAVDSHPEATFTGEVLQVRKYPVQVQYVVTFTVVVSAPNPDLLLLPGMTVNARIVLDARENVLRVPSAALRFRPPGAADAASATGAWVWTLDRGAPKPIPVEVGASDGVHTEVVGPLGEDTPVIVGQAASAPATERKPGTIFRLGG